MAAERLKDLSQPIDVPLLDATVGSFYGTGSKEERAQADQILRHLQNNPDMWLQVVHILQQTLRFCHKEFQLWLFLLHLLFQLYLIQTLRFDILLTAQLK
ncbi:hypothetical protein HRI_002072900 [Hibiscus trionum]|uniref:Importin N-terminal domain-containing protein n=1 Tax=Hibiscus trionum TaxID=183268 RepID=A0A9W7M1D1_HIBTR|nr:hypothetical protein HRI_002072900 [Hibiscus trionum]